MITLREPVNKLMSGIVSRGYVRSAEVGEPFAPPNDYHGAILMAQNSVPLVTLTGTREIRSVTLRIYANALTEPRGETELMLDEIQASFIEALCGDFDLGSTIEGIEPTMVAVQYGYQSIGQVIFRVMDITIPMVIDDSATFG